MTKIAIIDHSFHKQTKSVSFFTDLLRKNGIDFEFFYDESWQHGQRANIKLAAKKNFDVYLFWQIIPSDTELKAIEGRNIILVPMYDSHWCNIDQCWERLRYLNFICFSEILHRRFQRLGARSIYLKFFMPVNQDTIRRDTLRGFFWQRTSKITWPMIKTLLGKNHFDRFHIHRAIDPGSEGQFREPNQEDMARYNITFSDWFTDASEYSALLKECNLFFTPRLYEGIGMSFLEAMSLGMCIVAPDLPTMNEYILHGYNGLLYDPLNPQSLDFSKVHEIIVKSKRENSLGYRQWIESQPKLIDFLLLNNN